ncbi:hypothetical protein [Leptolyngbya sp. 7M]|uniref:hypothetical protein n=1 Tax=Leptolyngbya sp. 7M TaxID=2812896 RepID=UPI001B8C5CBE|nr:hypothetical protein [Leptolyngbya sp. 7M]QYO66582.1 hypothetical protein JVX88_07210 [Leptolyngbya sp. 7M]
MKRFRSLISAFVVAGFTFTFFAANADAQRRNERQIRDTFRSLNAQFDDMAVNLRFRLRSSSASRQVQQDAQSSLDAMSEALRTFSSNLDQRRENRSDMEDIISAANDIEGFLRGNPQGPRVEVSWSEVKASIGRLASYYGITPDWSGRISNASQTGDYGDDRFLSNSNLNGTYDLDRSRSERIADVIGSIRVSGEQRRDLESKLEAPEQIAISVRGERVTLASSKGSPITLTADGREMTEQSNGRTIRVRATLRGDELTISSIGGETDYTVTFVSENSGRGLKVTRRITTEYLNETIFADSIYLKTDQVAKLGIENNDSDDGYYDGADGYSSNDPDDRVGSNSPNPTLSKPRIGEFVVPNGTIITGVLENEVNTKVSQNNDRFRMTVQSPIEYRGAVIEGYISGVGRSGQISGRANVTFNFERITLRDGKAYDFGGFVQSVRDTQGKEIKVDNEGTAKSDSQTNETAKRGGIGAGLGALIGAIAGGAKGAVIGAVIGGGAGAGSVIIGGRDDIRLMPGSTVTIQSSSPIRQDGPR